MRHTTDHQFDIPKMYYPRWYQERFPNDLNLKILTELQYQHVYAHTYMPQVRVIAGEQEEVRAASYC